MNNSDLIILLLILLILYTTFIGKELPKEQFQIIFGILIILVIYYRGIRSFWWREEDGSRKVLIHPIKEN